MATKSKILKQLCDNYPNFLKKDISLFLKIIFKEIKQALQRNESCEIRGFGRFSCKIQKKRISRNPRTGEKVETLEKKKIHFKMAKELFNKLNNNE